MGMNECQRYAIGECLLQDFLYTTLMNTIEVVENMMDLTSEDLNTEIFGHLIEPVLIFTFYMQTKQILNFDEFRFSVQLHDAMRRPVLSNEHQRGDEQLRSRAIRLAAHQRKRHSQLLPEKTVHAGKSHTNRSHGVRKLL